MALFRKKKAKTEEDIQAELDAKKKASEALKNLISEDDDEKVDISFRSLIGGDIFAGKWFRRHFWYIVLCVLLCIIYTSNRYYCQKEIITQHQLDDTIRDRRYKLITISSQITEKTRRRTVERELADTALKTSQSPIYLLPIEEADTTEYE